MFTFGISGENSLKGPRSGLHTVCDYALNPKLCEARSEDIIIALIRPIIHPNPGFMRQLKDYEAKLRFRRSGIKRKYEADEFSYATVEEIYAFEVLEFEELEKIKARPKPRIMKPKLFTPEIGQAPLEIAQSYQITEISICFPDGATAVTSDATTQVKRGQPANRKPAHSSMKFPRGQSGLRSSKTSRTQLRPKSMPTRPVTPLPPQQNVIIQDPLSIAETLSETLMEAPSPGLTPKGSLKQRPYTKISEPAKVAVSHLSEIYGLCAPFKGSKADNFTAEFAHYSVFADIHLALVQKPEEILLQCLGPPAQHKLGPLPTTCKARTLVAPLRSGPPICHSPVICDCPGLYTAQKIEALPTQEPPRNVPSRFQGTGSSTTSGSGRPAGINRFGSTRASIKTPGLRISTIPTSHRKRPVPVLDLDFKHLAIIKQPPLILEKVTTKVKVFNPKYVKAKKVLWCPELKVLTTLEQKDQILDRVIKDSSLSFKLAFHLTQPLRTVILNPGCIQINQTMSWANSEILPAEQSVIPQKEYPYYR